MIVLVDTSVWIDHIDGVKTRLGEFLPHGQVVVHPFVAGEIALGTLHDRDVLGWLDVLPQAPVAFASEVREAIERHGLFETGIGYVDAHLLVSVLVTPDGFLLTRDKRLAKVAERLGILI